MRTRDSASGLQKGSTMKALRVIFLAAVALCGCGVGVEDEGLSQAGGQAQQGLMPSCYEVNCSDRKANVLPPETGTLPQDPVPLHTGLSQGALVPDGNTLKPR